MKHNRSVLRLRITATAALIAAVFGALAVASTAQADTQDDAGVRWSVSPSDENGKPDGRGAVEVELDPGESITDHFAVRNLSDQQVEFRLTAADGFTTRTGRFDMLSADETSVDAGTWIDLPETVTIDPQATAVVPFTIAVPDNAEPGDHAAGITASVLKITSAEDGTSVGVDSRVGFRVLTRVTGDIVPKASLTALASTYAIAWNPFRPGEATVTFDVVNEGNTRLTAEGSVEAGGQTVFFPAPGEPTQELLPGDTHSVSVVVDDIWPTLFVPATVTLDPTVTTFSDADATLEPVSADLMIWAPPIPQLIVLLGVILVAIALLWGRLRSRRKLDSLLATAREEGRIAAQADMKETAP